MEDGDLDEGAPWYRCPECGSDDTTDAHGGIALRCEDCGEVWGDVDDI
jgi:uncharacterized Zn finger protein